MLTELAVLVVVGAGTGSASPGGNNMLAAKQSDEFEVQGRFIAIDDGAPHTSQAAIYARLPPAAAVVSAATWERRKGSRSA